MTGQGLCESCQHTGLIQVVEIDGVAFAVCSSCSCCPNEVMHH